MKKELLKADTKIEEACNALLEDVNEIPEAERKAQIRSVKVDGVVIGYRTMGYMTFRRREVFVKVPGYKIDDLSDSERERIIGAIFNAFIISGAAMPAFTHPRPDLMVMRQDYVPMVPVERSPGLVSIAGGFDA